jgi:uncharacterized HAD superfamily protein
MFLPAGRAKIMLFLGNSSIFRTNVPSDALKIVGCHWKISKG